MLIIKVISVAIDVQNCINLYTDPDNVYQIITNKYEGRCIAGCFIKRVNRIMRVGDCVINQDGSPDFGVLPVTFEVSAIIYAPGEIINGCRVKNRDTSTGILICGTDNSNIMVAPHPLYASIVKNQLISVLVVGVKYTLSSEKIAVSAIPFTFARESSVYKVPPITGDIKSLLSDVLERIESEEDLAETIKDENPKAWNTFNQLLYAYKTPQTAPKDAKIIDIKDLLKSKTTQYVSRDKRIDLSQPSAYAYPKEPTEGNLRGEVPADSAYLIIFEDYCARLRMIRELVEIYSTEDLLTGHLNLWQIFKKNKL